MNRRLYRCRENRVVAGVASGLAEYLEVDPSLVRIVWFLSIFAGGIGIVLYIGMALIVPIEPYRTVAPGTEPGTDADAAAIAAGTGPGAVHNHGMSAGPAHAHGGGSGRITVFIGYGLILFGAIALLDMALPGWFSWRQLWPLFVIGLGGLLVFGALRRERESTE